MKQGFTLIELSIVLVIIGLIVGGILIGRDLIHAAELRNIISDLDQFKVASNTFRNKYGCPPGDCTKATNFFASAINGNGDEKLDYMAEEGFQYWYQLSNANLVSGTYTGTGAMTGTVVGAGGNIPESVFPKVGFNAFAQNSVGSCTSDGVVHANAFCLGKEYPGSKNANSALAAIDAQWLDIKLDDGWATEGKVRAYIGIEDPDPTHCQSGTAYVLTYNSPKCVVYFYF